MIWQSIAAMTGFDLAVVSIVSYAAVYFMRVRERLLRTTTRFGLWAIGFGLLLIAFFFVLDLATMHLLPLFMPRAEALGFMRELHSRYFGSPSRPALAP